MRYLYTVGFYLALPIILIRAFWRSRKTDHPKRLGERLGWYTHARLNTSLWVHAVSYGEAVAAEPLIRAIKQSFPDLPLVITTMTATGAIRVAGTWKNDPQIHPVYMPYDLPTIIKRFLRHHNPVLGVIMETELWPNVLHVAGIKQLPLILANGRLSPRSLKGYLRIKKLMAPLLRNITVLCTQTSADAERFIRLGAPQPQVLTVGNLKFDINPPTDQITQGLKIKAQLPFKQIIVAASTHANEEEQLIEAFLGVKEKFPEALLIIVPRHPERFDEVANLVIKRGLALSRRSTQTLPIANTSIFIGDTLGELYFFYALADIAFVGGSLVPIGGHNLLEPAALKLPIVTGPHLFNFTAISLLLKATQTLHISEDPMALTEVFCQLLGDPAYRAKVGLAGCEVLNQNRGATERHLTIINDTLQNHTALSAC